MISFITFVLCYCAWLAFAARYIPWTTRKFLQSNLHSIFEADISWFFEPSSTPEVHLFLCRLLFYCPPCCIFQHFILNFLCNPLPVFINLFLAYTSPTHHLLRVFNEKIAYFLIHLFERSPYVSWEATSSDPLCVASLCRTSLSAFFYFNFSSTLLISSHCFLSSSSSYPFTASPSSTLFSICI